MTVQDARVVAVANGLYATQPSLVAAADGTIDLVTLLHDEFGFERTVVLNRRRGDVLDDLDVALAPRSLSGGKLIVLWTGHGVFGPDGLLQLLVRTSDVADGKIAAASELGEWAARTGATQILIVIDTCFSGKGVMKAAEVASLVNETRADPGAGWFGVLAASRSDEQANSGALPKALIRLLRDGPQSKQMQVRWGGGAEITYINLIEALRDEWSEPRHTPDQVNTGWGQMLRLRNPLFRPKAPSVVVEHLLQAAGGNSFTGRVDALRGIVAWLRAGSCGIKVITGPGGCGKSAVLGRIVSLSVPTERSRLQLDELAEDLDPGESAISANVHARGMTVASLVQDLAIQLGEPKSANLYDLLGSASRQRATGHPVVIVVDGLDEAGDRAAREIATQLLAPLGREALVLVGTREIATGAEEAGLLALLDSGIPAFDLAADVESMLRDVHDYVERRLRGRAPTMDVTLVAAEIVATAQQTGPERDGPFLLARLVTSQLRETPVDTSTAEWRRRVASTVEEALDSDLAGAVMTVNGRVHPTAARELLCALAFAKGHGLSPDQIWPAIATALSPTKTTYTRDDCFDVMMLLGRHVVAGTENTVAVYRVAHQRLVDQLRPMIGTGMGRGLAPSGAEAVAAAVADLYRQQLDAGEAADHDTYLWRYAWEHLADAGPFGIALLREFVQRDRGTFLLDLAMALAQVALRQYWSGAEGECITLCAESADLFRELDETALLVQALHLQALAYSTSGNHEEASNAIAEATRLARSRADDDPLLARSLGVQALMLLRQGQTPAAAELAAQVIDMLNADEPGNAILLASMCSSAAQAALLLGDVARADELSMRAVRLVKATTDLDAGARSSLLLEVLASRSRVESYLLQRSSEFRPSAAEEVLRIFREQGPSGGLSDVNVAETLRQYALIRSMELAKDIESEGPTPRALLVEAVEVLERLGAHNTDAAITLAATFATRRSLPDSTPEERSADYAAAAAAFRRFDPSYQRTGVQFSALVLDHVRERIAVGELLTDDDINDLGWILTALDGQNEPLATDLRRRAGATLAMTLMQAGRYSDAERVTADNLAFIRRGFTGTSADVLALVAALVDHSGSSATYSIESEAEAREGLGLLTELEMDTPTTRLLRATLQNNLGFALLRLGRTGDASEWFATAAASMDEEDGQSLFGSARAATMMASLVNLAQIEVSKGDYHLALEHSTHALTLSASIGPGADPAGPAMAQLHRGTALRGLGREEDGSREIAEAVSQLHKYLSDDPVTIGRFASALNAAGEAAWNVALAELATDRPEITKRLRLFRTRPEEELEQDVADLAAATADADLGLALTARVATRLARGRNPVLFDSAWGQVVGEVPAWIRIDFTLEQQFDAWWDTDSWEQSKRFLDATPSLLHPDTDLLIEEFRGIVDDQTVDLHLTIRSTAAIEGIDAAYAPLLAAELIDDWAEAPDAQAFFAEHTEQLTGADVNAVLLEYAATDPGARVMLALLVLIARGEQSVAFGLLDTPESGVDLLQPAWRSADIERLRALAMLVCEGEPEASSSTMGLTALAIAASLTDAMAEARQAVSRASHLADDAGQVIRSCLSDAIAFQPDGIGHLVELLRELPAPA